MASVGIAFGRSNKNCNWLVPKWQTWHTVLIFWILITGMAQWRSLFWDLEQIFAFLHWIGWVDFQIWVPFIKRCLNEEWYLSWEREPFSVPYPPRGTNLINKSDLDQLSSLKPTHQEGLVSSLMLSPPIALPPLFPSKLFNHICHHS